MESWMLYVVGIFVVVMVYILALGGAAMVGGKFDGWSSRFLTGTKTFFKWKRKRFQRF